MWMLMLLLMLQATAPVKTMLGPGVISSGAGADAATFGPGARRAYFSSQRKGAIGVWSISLEERMKGKA